MNESDRILQQHAALLTGDIEFQMPAARRWLVTEAVHVVPLGDLREHECSPTCFCRPTEDEETPGLWVHHALDGREKYETGELKPQ